MSLDWNVSNVEDFKNYCWKPTDKEGEVTLNPDTEMLIWASLAIGLGKITEDNVNEWRFRMLVKERIDQPIGYRFEKTKRIPYTPSIETIRRHIGLTANVGNIVRTTWMKQVMKEIGNQVERDMAYENAKQKEKARITDERQKV